MSQWNFNKNSKYGPNSWKSNFPTCKVDGQSPININTNETRICNLMCQLKIHYKPNQCRIQNDNNLMNILYDNDSYVIYKSESINRYNLFKIVPHIPGLHQVNNLGYDMELHLHHRNKQGKILIIAILINVDQNFSNSQDFFNQFVPNLRNVTSTSQTADQPGQEFNQEYNYSINVSSNWNVENVLPVLRNFFIYKGTLPYPPCSNDILWVIFENTVNINQSDFEILKERLVYPNSRPIFPLNSSPTITRFVYYNNDIGVGIGSKMKGKIYIKCKKIQKNNNTYTESKQSNTSTNSSSNNNSTTTSTTTSNSTDTSLQDFFNSDTWKSVKSLLSWVVAIYIVYKYIVPNMNYSFEYNKALYNIVTNPQDYTVKIRDKVHIFDPLKKDNRNALLHEMVKAYLKENTDCKFDLSNDTWFNQYILRLFHFCGWNFYNLLTGGK